MMWWCDMQELTVFDIGHLAVWCEAFTVDFGHVTLPRAQLSNIPPSLKMLGVSPQVCNLSSHTCKYFGSNVCCRNDCYPYKHLFYIINRPHLVLAAHVARASS